ncbi:hypothetical protein BJ138DRAFT_1102684 [Hygrophoropsis aurantiaca]|uniref:Uncharacterized protein n=1 Tax=Hygrophoropsis aurantiaca TaxID=72124 RepID=A0ACB8A8P6_9AGAM|nr:hypothetical protein BJ138DRAFT_1102684 [Hygrophoropsis aurantiaca]
MRGKRTYRELPDYRIRERRLGREEYRRHELIPSWMKIFKSDRIPPHTASEFATQWYLAGVPEGYPLPSSGPSIRQTEEHTQASKRGNMSVVRLHLTAPTELVGGLGPSMRQTTGRRLVAVTPAQALMIDDHQSRPELRSTGNLFNREMFPSRLAALICFVTASLVAADCVIDTDWSDKSQFMLQLYKKVDCMGLEGYFNMNTPAPCQNLNKDGFNDNVKSWVIQNSWERKIMVYKDKDCKNEYGLNVGHLLSRFRLGYLLGYAYGLCFLFFPFSLDPMPPHPNPSVLSMRYWYGGGVRQTKERAQMSKETIGPHSGYSEGTQQPSTEFVRLA